MFYGKAITEINPVKNAAFAILDLRNDAWLVGFFFQLTYTHAVFLNMCMFL